jgi:hypothetical protein
MTRTFKQYQVIFLLGLTSCTNSFETAEVLGTYVPIDYKNNFDTIEIREHEYERTVRDKSKKLLLRMKGACKLSENNSRIQINSFYQNFDDDLIKFPELVNDTNLEISTTFDQKSDEIIFCIGHDVDSNCYRKIKPDR